MYNSNLKFVTTNKIYKLSIEINTGIGNIIIITLKKNYNRIISVIIILILGDTLRDINYLIWARLLSMTLLCHQVLVLATDNQLFDCKTFLWKS